MDPRTFGINAMLADMEPLLRRLTGDGIELAFIQAAGLWPVQLPPGKLEEVFLAIAVDACHAMVGGGTLRVETANASRPDGLPAGDYVMLAISDTSRQLSEAVRGAVRGHGRREGLGIRLAYEIADAAGGDVELEPNGEGGMTVRLLLPRADAPLPARDLGEAAGLATGSETILIVEDEKTLMSVASRVLTRLGYSVLSALTAEAAVRELEQFPGPVHLLLTDLVLPGMDGVSLAAEVRKRRPDVKVLYMSGYSQDALQLRGVVGADFQLLEKPFTLEGLAQRVRSVLG